MITESEGSFEKFVFSGDGEYFFSDSRRRYRESGQGDLQREDAVDSLSDDNRTGIMSLQKSKYAVRALSRFTTDPPIASVLALYNRWPAPDSTASLRLTFSMKAGTFLGEPIEINIRMTALFETKSSISDCSS